MSTKKKEQFVNDKIQTLNLKNAHGIDKNVDIKYDFKLIKK